MRPAERFFLYVGALVTVVLALSFQHSDPALAARPEPTPVRIATCDIFMIADKMMERPENKAPRDAIVEKWKAKVKLLDDEIQRLQSTLQVLPPNDPQVQGIMTQGRAKSNERQMATEEGTNEVQKISSDQLVAAYNQVKGAVDTVSSRLGYTHVLCSRSASKPIESKNVNSTLQEFLARPVIKSDPADDLTQQVMAELKIE